MKQIIVFFSESYHINQGQAFIDAILLQGMLFLEKYDATSPETKGLSVDQSVTYTVYHNHHYSSAELRTILIKSLLKTLYLKLNKQDITAYL